MLPVKAGEAGLNGGVGLGVRDESVGERGDVSPEVKNGSLAEGVLSRGESSGLGRRFSGRRSCVWRSSNASGAGDGLDILESTQGGASESGGNRLREGCESRGYMVWSVR